MFCGMSFYQICSYFIIYSFVGWVVEVAYHAVTLGKVVNRGFLNGPLCPVYGFGMLAVLSIAHFIPLNEAGQINTPLLFLTGLIFTTLIELIAGWILDKAFHARWWDYSEVPLNLNGYICLKFSIIWGLAVLIAVKIFHPVVEHLSLAALSPKIGWIILAVIYAHLFADLGITIATVSGLNKNLKKIDDLQEKFRKPSDKMSEIITEGTLKISNSVEEAKIQAALGKAELKDSLEEKKNQLEEYKIQKEEELAKIFASKNWGTRRLLRAFPKMKHSKYSETLQELKTYFQSHIKKEKKETQD
ncbi:MAG: hypothetical protein K5829_15385 [Treponema sp.]|nr:hypothetical protein [Treponema sp.]